jgi:hypothetical protein
MHALVLAHHTGSRRKVGFQYDLDADTVEEVAQEMVDSLSINWEDARFVAGLIQVSE